MSESYWVIPTETDERAPLTMLREQANALTEATDGQLRGHVTTTSFSNYLNISLSVVAPALDGYTVEIITYRQPALIYPGTFESIEGGSVTIKNEKEFSETLKSVLSSTAMQRMIASLLSQIKAF